MTLSPPTPRSLPQPGHLYDVAVIGAGLAGCELAWRLARAGRDVLLVTQALDSLGNLYQPQVTDVDFPPGSLFEAVRSAPLADGSLPLDGWTFHRLLKAELEATPGIHLLQSTVTGLEEGESAEEEGAAEGDSAPVTLTTWEGPRLRARQAVLAAGAFLKGRLLIGDTLEEAGRLSEVAYDFLADDLAAHGVWLIGGAQEAPPSEGAPGYEVRFLTLAPAELSGFRVSRFEAVWALGRCTPGEHSYRSVLEDAARLAAELPGGAGEGA